MTKHYNVHLYREMRLYFPGIKADSPEQAAIAYKEFPCEFAADQALDCDGETFCALVDLQGDPDFSQSMPVDFEAERMRMAAPQLLSALLEAVAEIEYWHADLLSEEERRHPRGNGWARVYDKATAAIRLAKRVAA